MGTEKPLRVVLDTNILVSGLLFGGSPGELLTLCREGRFQAVASRAMVDEILRVLTYPKFRLTEKEIEYLLYREILPLLVIISVVVQKNIVAADPSDDMFLYCATAADAEAIVSGDHHLLSLGSHQGIPILTVADFLESFASR
jgi:putative PIN family toxin of toxin-antitoxin system